MNKDRRTKRLEMVYTVPEKDFSSSTVAMGSCLAFDGASTTYNIYGGKSA